LATGKQGLVARDSESRSDRSEAAVGGAVQRAGSPVLPRLQILSAQL